MKTRFRTDEKYAKIFLELANTITCTGDVVPKRFQDIMWKNRGETAMFSAFPMPEDRLERKNPLIVGIGDSVTAGHFEFIMNPEELKNKISEGTLTAEDRTEVTDVQEGYLDRFRRKLIEKYESSSVSVINSGIAGDTILGMEKRLDRDVLRYQPDLVLINASLNWGQDCGSNEQYYMALKAVVLRVQNETNSDIILMTPNAALPTPFDHPESTLFDRVQIIRKLAKELSVCLVDTYKIWNAYIGTNHPSITGHEVYAIALMQLISQIDNKK